MSNNDAISNARMWGCNGECQARSGMGSIMDQLAPEQQLERPRPNVFFDSNALRRRIIAAYWIVILLASPLWWYTTSIQRLPLPASQVSTQAERRLSFPVELRVDEAAFKASGATGVSVVEQLNTLLASRKSQAPEKWEGINVILSSGSEETPDITAGSYPPHINDRGQLAFDYATDRSLLRLSELIESLMVPYSLASREHRVAPYASRYRLAFSILNEDASDGRAVKGWDIKQVISRHISPILESLSPLHNFSIESQVQFYAPLALKPSSLGNEGYGLTSEDLSVFVNSADWTLSSGVSNDPVLHFIVFVPAASRSPLRILDASGHPSSANSFLLPQWGGIYIHNLDPLPGHSGLVALDHSELRSAFSTFSRQLLTLLGVPQLPPGVQANTNALTRWQLDALLRRRARENVENSQDTLSSIVKLVDQIENMPVDHNVRDTVQDSLSALEQTFSSASGSPKQALQHSSQALTSASKAFFDPSMLALLYFPAEHKYAVYSPLFASGLLPLLLTAIKEVKAWKQERRRATAA